MRTIADCMDFRNNYDALRLIAAIAVIFSHAYPATLGSNDTEPLYSLSQGQMTIGSVCVAVFFVISGFLISQSFVRSKSLSEYVLNRVVRILPGLFVLIVLTCLVFGPLVTSVPDSEYWSSYLTWRYLGNISIYLAAQKLPGVFQNNISPDVTNASIWTLGYEFTCYLFIAGIGLLLKKNWIKAALVLAFAALTMTFLTSYIFIEFLSYFMAGAVAYAARRWVPLSFPIFIISLFALASATLMGYGLKLAFCVFGAYSIMYLAYVRLPRILPFFLKADLSYGTYLYAWPVQQFLAPCTSTPSANFWLSLPVVLLLAALSWSLVEKPSLARKKVLAERVRSLFLGINQYLA